VAKSGNTDSTMTLSMGTLSITTLSMGTLSIMTLSMTTLSIMTLSMVTLSIMMLYASAECNYAELPLCWESQLRPLWSAPFCFVRIYHESSQICYY
jgi:hypothetical protein